MIFERQTLVLSIFLQVHYCIGTQTLITGHSEVDRAGR